MAVPKKKSSKARTHRRFASFVTRKRNQLEGRTHLMVCDSCGAAKLAHHVCAACGMYKGRQVITVTKTKKVTKIEA
ncbi:50S ribosomal protein L32 [Candidatus Gracilibacteria bacterium CG17_big_fil_post_rev_8_21_14_2_50_48_13]|nr:MAG: 50S ribosomal protein L32 [Candidatus Gracilibacteria bacterium CG17_big_fil_post_rev_8_21_14_2_50_48_13]